MRRQLISNDIYLFKCAFDGGAWAGAILFVLATRSTLNVNEFRVLSDRERERQREKSPISRSFDLIWSLKFMSWTFSIAKSLNRSQKRSTEDFGITFSSMKSRNAHTTPKLMSVQMESTWHHGSNNADFYQKQHKFTENSTNPSKITAIFQKIAQIHLKQRELGLKWCKNVMNLTIILRMERLFHELNDNLTNGKKNDVDEKKNETPSSFKWNRNQVKIKWIQWTHGNGHDLMANLR